MQLSRFDFNHLKITAAATATAATLRPRTKSRLWTPPPPPPVRSLIQSYIKTWFSCLGINRRWNVSECVFRAWGSCWSKIYGGFKSEIVKYADCIRLYDIHSAATHECCTRLKSVYTTLIYPSRSVRVPMFRVEIYEKIEKEKSPSNSVKSFSDCNKSCREDFGAEMTALSPESPRKSPWKYSCHETGIPPPPPLGQT